MNLRQRWENLFCLDGVLYVCLRCGSFMLPVSNVERTPASSSLLDVLDRVLDKGIVIDAWVRLSVIGIELVTVEARVVVASITTYLGYSEALAEMKTAAAPHPKATMARVKRSRSSPLLPVKKFVVYPLGTTARSEATFGGLLVCAPSVRQLRARRAV